MRWDCLCSEQLREEFVQQQKKSMQKHSISISNRSCLIHWPTELLEGCQFVKAASAQQHLLMMQHPSLSQPPLHRMWSGRCLLHDMKHVERREQGECLGYRTQSQSTGIRCHIPATVDHLTWITHSVCLSGSSLDYFFIWGQRRTTCPLCQCVYAAAGCRCACAEEVWT